MSPRRNLVNRSDAYQVQPRSSQAAQYVETRSLLTDASVALSTSFLQTPETFLQELFRANCGVTSVNWCGIGWTPGREWLQSGLDLGRPFFSIYCASSFSMRSPSFCYRFPERVRVHPQSWVRQLLHHGRQGKGG